MRDSTTSLGVPYVVPETLVIYRCQRWLIRESFQVRGRDSSRCFVWHPLVRWGLLQTSKDQTRRNFVPRRPPNLGVSSDLPPRNLMNLPHAGRFDLRSTRGSLNGERPEITGSEQTQGWHGMVYLK